MNGRAVRNASDNLYVAADKLALHEPVDYTRLTAVTQDEAVRWMNRIHAPMPVAQGR